MATTPSRKAGQHGKAAPQFPAGLKNFAQYLSAPAGAPLPDPPAAVDAYEAVKDWPMFGNDKYGDCTMAAAAHAIQLWNAVTAQSDPVPPLAAVVAEYFTLSGGQDSGLVESNVLKAWRASGLWGHRIFGYAPINVHDQASLQRAIHWYGLAYVGIQVPANADAQFEAHKPWTLDSGWQSQQIKGGHAIPIVGYDKDYWYVVTWGSVQPMAYDWWRVYGDEAWAIVPQEFKEAGGFDHLDFAQLLADLKQL